MKTKQVDACQAEIEAQVPTRGHIQRVSSSASTTIPVELGRATHTVCQAQVNMTINQMNKLKGMMN